MNSFTTDTHANLLATQTSASERLSYAPIEQESTIWAKDEIDLTIDEQDDDVAMELDVNDDVEIRHQEAGGSKTMPTHTAAAVVAASSSSPPLSSSTTPQSSSSPMPPKDVIEEKSLINSNRSPSTSRMVTYVDDSDPIDDAEHKHAAVTSSSSSSHQVNHLNSNSPNTNPWLHHGRRRSSRVPKPISKQSKDGESSDNDDSKAVASSSRTARGRRRSSRNESGSYAHQSICISDTGSNSSTDDDAPLATLPYPESLLSPDHLPPPSVRLALWRHGTFRATSAWPRRSPLQRELYEYMTRDVVCWRCSLANDEDGTIKPTEKDELIHCSGICKRAYHHRSVRKRRKFLPSNQLVTILLTTDCIILLLFSCA